MFDVYLSWDQARNHFVLAALMENSGAIRYGSSSDAWGTSWSIGSAPAIISDNPNYILWDYPSIGVKNNGDIVVGGVKFDVTQGQTAKPIGFFTTVSTNGGVSWSAPARVGSTGGHHSRVVATDNKFVAFIQLVDSSGNPIGIDKHESTDGINWGTPTRLVDYSPPLNNSPQAYSNSCGNAPCSSCASNACTIWTLSCGRVFYSPYLDAKGYGNGLWAVVAPINNNGYNNAYICTPDRGCGIVNSTQDDQFLVSTSISGDNGYWVSYLTYSTLATRNLPVIVQSIYFPPGQYPIGATTYNPSDPNTSPDPRSWKPECGSPSGQAVCKTLNCFESGDYYTMTSNAYQASSSPVVTKSSANLNNLLQIFAQDPPQSPNVPNFKPAFIPHFIGTDLRGLGRPLTEDTSAGLRVGPPKAREKG